MRQDLTPKGLARQAEKAFREGNYLEAVIGFKEAATAYQDQGQTLLAAEMWNNCGVALVQLGQGDEALKVIQPTLTLLESEGDLERLGIAYGNLASALEVCGRYEEAQKRICARQNCWKNVGKRSCVCMP